MSKKDLLQQNTVLFDNLNKFKLENIDLKKELEIKSEVIAGMQQRIDLLTKQIDELKAKVPQFKIEMGDDKTSDVLLNEPAEPVINNNSSLTLSEEIEYGAKVIGKIVVEQAKANEKVGDNSELKNLMLFKTECIKTEILTICNSEVPLSDKIRLIDDQFIEATDYFRSIIAQ